MSYNARVRARQNRAGGLYGIDRGWEVGSNQGGAIGIPARLVRKINEKTTPINYDGNGVKRDDRNLVVQQNTLSGIGRYRSQFNVDADGIEAKRYYLDDQVISGFDATTLSDDWSAMFLFNAPSAAGPNFTILIDGGITNISQLPPPPQFQFNASWTTKSATVTNMAGMFVFCDQFTGVGIETWNTSLVENFSGMFWGASSFNANINDWDVTGVTNHLGIVGMFRDASSFNKPLNTWVFSVVSDSLQFMFAGASSFNQNINTDGLTWVTTNITLMDGMFEGATAFNQPIVDWDVAAVTKMESMFKDAEAFNQDIAGWFSGGPHAIINMKNMFNGATDFDQDLSTWVITGADIEGMFTGATALLAGFGPAIRVAWLAAPNSFSSAELTAAGLPAP